MLSCKKSFDSKKLLESVFKNEFNLSYCLLVALSANFGAGGCFLVFSNTILAILIDVSYLMWLWLSVAIHKTPKITNTTIRVVQNIHNSLLTSYWFKCLSSAVAEFGRANSIQQAIAKYFQFPNQC